MVIVFGFNNRDWDVGLVIKDAVRPFRFAATDELAANDDAALGETDFLADLGHLIPTHLLDGRDDELGADVAFAEQLLIHAANPLM